MARPPRQINYTKLVYEADKTKSKVKQNKIAAYEKWQKKMGGRGKKLDDLDKRLRELLKEVEAAQKAKKDQADAVAKIMNKIAKAFQELKTYKEIPVGQKLPELPKNAIEVHSMAVVLTAMIAYLAAVKVYLAMAEALKKK